MEGLTVSVINNTWKLFELFYFQSSTYRTQCETAENVS